MLPLFLIVVYYTALIWIFDFDMPFYQFIDNQILRWVFLAGSMVGSLLWMLRLVPIKPARFNSDRLSKPIFYTIISLWALMVYYTVVPWLFGYELPRNTNIDLSLLTWVFVGLSLVNTGFAFFMHIGFLIFKNRTIAYQTQLIKRKRYATGYPLVSIIIPARNEESVIRRTIGTCLGQTYKAIEIIVVCHNCTDRTFELSHSRDPRVRPLDYKTDAAGKGLALNYGVSQARGDYLLIIDSDAILKSDFIANAMPFFDEGYAAVQGKMVTSNRDYNRITKLLALEGDLFSTPFMTVRAILDRRVPLGGTGLMLSKKVLAKVGGFSNALIEDFELSFRLYRAGARIAFAPLSIVYDEKPPYLELMIRQRSRWVKGHFDLLKQKIPENRDIIGIVYWLVPLFMIGGFTVITVTSFATIYYLLFGIIPFKFSYLPVGIWIVASILSTSLQIAVLIREMGIRGVKYAGHAALMSVFSHYWYVTLLRSPFVKSWSTTKTVHGFITDKDMENIVLEKD